MNICSPVSTVQIEPRPSVRFHTCLCRNWGRGPGGLTPPWGVGEAQAQDHRKVVPPAGPFTEQPKEETLLAWVGQQGRLPFWATQEPESWKCSVGHRRLPPLQLTPPVQPQRDHELSAWGWPETLRYMYILVLFSCLGFFFFLSVTSAFCFLSFQMFPNTSCLVRCLRQTERCRWRQCFIVQCVHSFISKLKQSCKLADSACCWDFLGWFSVLRQESGGKQATEWRTDSPLSYLLGFLMWRNQKKAESLVCLLLNYRQKEKKNTEINKEKQNFGSPIINITEFFIVSTVMHCCFCLFVCKKYKVFGFTWPLSLFPFGIKFPWSLLCLFSWKFQGFSNGTSSNRPFRGQGFLVPISITYKSPNEAS